MENQENLTSEKPHKISTTISHALWSVATANNWSWADLLAFAVQFRLAENYLSDYPANKLSTNIAKCQARLSDVSQKYYELLEKYNEVDPLQRSPDFDEFKLRK